MVFLLPDAFASRRRLYFVPAALRLNVARFPSLAVIFDRS
jgi:hypothetical protein